MMFGDDEKSNSNSDEAQITESLLQMEAENIRLNEISDKLKKLDIRLRQNVSRMECLENLTRVIGF